MTAPYLDRPLRTLDEALLDRIITETIKRCADVPEQMFPYPTDHVGQAARETAAEIRELATPEMLEEIKRWARGVKGTDG